MTRVPKPSAIVTEGQALAVTALWSWVRWCESHPDAWAAGDYSIPLADIGLTFNEADAVFGVPTLAEVRQAATELTGQDGPR